MFAAKTLSHLAAYQAKLIVLMATRSGDAIEVSTMRSLHSLTKLSAMLCQICLDQKVHSNWRLMCWSNKPVSDDDSSQLLKSVIIMGIHPVGFM